MASFKLRGDVGSPASFSDQEELLLNSPFRPGIAIQYFVLCCVCLCFPFMLAGCSQKSGVQGPLPNQVLVGELKRVSPLFVMSYTTEFARRFNLPENNAKTLSTGLDAIAVEIQPQVAQINCLLHLYLNNQVNVYVPNNYPDFSEKPLAEYFFVIKYGQLDRKYNVNEVDKSLTRIAYRSKSVASGGDNGWVDTPDIYRYKSNFLPDLSLLSLNIGCSNLDPQYAPAEILVQKAGTQDYKVGLEDLSNIKNKDLVYSFDIPLELHRYIKKYIDFAAVFNTEAESSLGSDEKLPSVEIR